MSWLHDSCPFRQVSDWCISHFLSVFVCVHTAPSLFFEKLRAPNLYRSGFGVSITGFLDNVHRLVFLKEFCVKETGYFRPQVKRWGVPLQLHLLERANLNHWSQ
jgi:hypothetical protein